MDQAIVRHQVEVSSAAYLLLKRRVMLARASFNEFVPYVMRDKDGTPLELGAIHRVWDLHIQTCWDTGKYAAVFGPWSHGKTTMMIARICWMLGRNPNLRIKIASNTDSNAMKRVMECGRLLASPAYRQVFPNIVLAKQEVGPDGRKRGTGARSTQHHIVVKRPGSVDASIEAVGITSSGIGGRADVMFFDDIVDQKNAIAEPGTREKICDDFDMVWMGRLEPGGFAALWGTFWHRADLHHRLLNRPAWCSLRQSISQDFERIDQDVFNPPESYPIPLAERLLRVAG